MDFLDRYMIIFEILIICLFNLLKYIMIFVTIFMTSNITTCWCDIPHALKYLTISQHDDDLYTTLDKMRHLLVSHYVKNGVQSFNVAFCTKMQVQKLYLHHNKSYALNWTQNDYFFLATFIII
jgi:hypothetical protein